MAAATPTGTDATRATETSQTVPMSAGMMPPVVIPSRGMVVRNSQERTGPPL